MDVKEKAQMIMRLWGETGWISQRYREGCIIFWKHGSKRMRKLASESNYQADYTAVRKELLRLQKP